MSRRGRGHGPQSPESLRRVSAGSHHLCHGSERIGKEHAGDGDAGAARAGRIGATGVGRGGGARENATAGRPHPDPLPEGEGNATAALLSAAGISGIEAIGRLVEIDQSPLGRNARSNPATASGMWDEIRRIFARTRDARLRGFRASRFSFNAAGGRCEECHGNGVRRLAMQFLPDVDVVCPVCRGKRFNRETLQVQFRGKSVADILEMRIDEAAEFFKNFAGLSATLQTFVDVGLAYLTLGQSAATLSGGEAQRIKLAVELSGTRNMLADLAAPRGRTLYVLDEPTTGLHPADIARLLDLLDRLADAGHTVVVIEHQLDVIARADWVIDLGPEGAPPAAGSSRPEHLTRSRASPRVTPVRRCGGSRCPAPIEVGARPHVRSRHGDKESGRLTSKTGGSVAIFFVFSLSPPLLVLSDFGISRH